MKAIAVGLIVGMCVALGASQNLQALSPVVVSQLQTGDTTAATNEAVELYNNGSTDHDITNWCLRYSSAQSMAYTSSPRYCFTPSDALTRIFLSARSHAAIVTSNYLMPLGISPDGRFSGSGMAAAGGHIWLTSETAVIDAVGWGSAVHGEGYSATYPAPAAPTALQSLVRKGAPDGSLQDTNNNRADFEARAPMFRTGGIYEVRTVQDVCGNIADIQERVPTEYGYDEAGNCELLRLDTCANIAAVQLEVPHPLMLAEDGNCYTDTCPNIDGLQQLIPSGYRLQADSCVELEMRELWLNEILPNVSGSDSGQEFVELYNPHDTPISLYGYVLIVGKNLEHEYVLESTTDIPGHGYVVLGDDEVGFTLLNTSSQLRLRAPAGNIVSETYYTEPRDNQSWAWLDGSWQYTDQLTPYADNVAMTHFVEEVEGIATVSAVCPAGKYRHPITNRCRNIESDSVMLVACDADEYRNPETNRCRKVAALASALTPCNPGYERNSETNRCRKIVTADNELAACQAGYERNPATNRCRKSMAAAAAAATPASAIASSSGSLLTNALIITAGLGAAGYGLFEWRSELVRGARRLIHVVSGK